MFSLLFQTCFGITRFHYLGIVCTGARFAAAGGGGGGGNAGLATMGVTTTGAADGGLEGSWLEGAGMNGLSFRTSWLLQPPVKPIAPIAVAEMIANPKIFMLFFFTSKPPLCYADYKYFVIRYLDRMISQARVPESGALPSFRQSRETLYHASFSPR